MIVEALGIELEETPWMDRAACAGSDPDMFFPDQGEPAQPARNICASCPVRDDCLEYALTWRIEFGVWGGLTTRERRRLAATRTVRRLAAPHGTTTRYARGCRCPDCAAASYLYKLSRSEEAG